MTGNKNIPPKCTCCGGNGGRVFHSNKKSCPLKNSYGDCIEINKFGKANVGNDFAIIFNGKHGFVDISTLGGFLHHTYMKDNLPRGTKRIQIKSFSVKNIREYILCTCYDQQGKELQI